jgi:hypothetical protein
MREAEAFTPESVFALLQKVLKSGRWPHPTDPALANLAHVLNTLRWKVRGWTGPWLKELEDLQRIGEAILVLSELLPTQRENYAASPGMLERWGRTDAAVDARAHRAAFNASVVATRARLAAAGAEADLAAFNANVTAARARNTKMEVHADRAAAQARARLAAFDALVTAALAARELGLPMVNNPVVVMTPRTERWRDFAEQLAAIFHSLLPGRPKAAVYRFIAGVAPDISGEHPSFLDVEVAFKQKRFAAPQFAQLEIGENRRVKTASKKKHFAIRDKRAG